MLNHVNREACLLSGALVCPNLSKKHLGLRPYNPDLQEVRGVVVANKASLENVGTDLGDRGGGGG